MARRPLALALLFGMLTCHAVPPPETRPAEVAPAAGAASAAQGRAWAQPDERPGLPNLHRVAPNLWRGAQPTEEGFRELERMGVRTVLSLRGFHGDELPAGSPLAYERISFKTWHPEDEDVVRFLRIVSDPARQPVFVHCQHGADRTGTMCAIYRVACEGWTKEQALAEMVEGGFGFHSIWTNLIDYVRELDVEGLAAAAGVGRPVEAR